MNPTNCYKAFEILHDDKTLTLKQKDFGSLLGEARGNIRAADIAGYSKTTKTAEVIAP